MNMGVAEMGTRVQVGTYAWFGYTGLNGASISPGFMAGSDGSMIVSCSSSRQTEFCVGSSVRLSVGSGSYQVDVNGTFRVSDVSYFNSKVILSASTAPLASLNFPDGVTPTSPVAGDIWRSNGRISFQQVGIHCSYGRSDTLRAGAFLELSNGQGGNGVVLQAGTTNLLDVYDSFNGSLKASVYADGGGYFSGLSRFGKSFSVAYTMYGVISGTVVINPDVSTHIFKNAQSSAVVTISNGRKNGQQITINVRHNSGNLTLTGSNIWVGTTTLMQQASHTLTWNSADGLWY